MSEKLLRHLLSDSGEAVSKSELYRIGFRSKLSPVPSRINAVSPISLKLTSSSDNLKPRYTSPALKVKQELAELINEMRNSSNSIKKSKAAFKALKICANEEGLYTNEMKAIVDSIQDALFIDKSKIDSEILAVVYERYTDAIIESEQVPFVYVIEGAQHMIDIYKKENSEIKSQMNSKKNELRSELKERRMEISTLKAYIEMNIAEPIRIKDLQIKNLEEKVSASNKKISQLNEQVFENEEILKQLKSQANSHKRRILELQGTEEENNLKLGQQTKLIDELKKELKKLQEENHKIRYYLETSFIKLKQVSDREKNLEVRNSELEMKNHELGIRAGQGFENLTPRPSFGGADTLLSDLPRSTSAKVKKIIEFAAMSKHSPPRKMKKRQTKIWTGLLKAQLENTTEIDDSSKIE